MPNFFDESGNVTEDFRTELPNMLGTEHAESKMFNDIIDREDKTEASDIALMIKSGADTKAMVGKKMDNVIQRPGENPTDDEKAEYTKTLLTSLGLGEKHEDFKLTMPDDLPEGFTANDENDKEFTQWCMDNDIPKSVAERMYTRYMQKQVELINKGVEAAKTKADEADALWESDCGELKTDWPGTELGKGIRTALKAMQAFEKDDVGFMEALDKSGLYTNPENFAALREAGVDIHSLRKWRVIGDALLDSEFLRGKAFTADDKSSEAKLARMYDHSTSQELHVKK